MCDSNLLFFDVLGSNIETYFKTMVSHEFYLILGSSGLSPSLEVKLLPLLFSRLNIFLYICAHLTWNSFLSSPNQKYSLILFDDSTRTCETNSGETLWVESQIWSLPGVTWILFPPAFLCWITFPYPQLTNVFCFFLLSCLLVKDPSLFPIFFLLLSFLSNIFLSSTSYKLKEQRA